MASDATLAPTHRGAGPDNVRCRAGVLGGTFDPIHLGHLILAVEARAQLDLSLVYFVPAGDPPHKRERRLAPVSHRLRMIELAIAGNNHFRASRVDSDRPGPHYTLDMVNILQRQLGDHTELFFLMGYDSLAEFPSWHRAAELLATCHLVALTRYNVPLDWPCLEARLPGIRERVTLLEMPELEISSREIQERIHAERTTRYLVPDDVRLYIEDQRLYR